MGQRSLQCLSRLTFRSRHQLLVVLCSCQTVYFAHLKHFVQYIVTCLHVQCGKVFSMSANESVETFPLANNYTTCLYELFSRASCRALQVAVKPYRFWFHGVNNVKKKAIYAQAIIAVFTCHSVSFPKCNNFSCHAFFICSADTFSVLIAYRPVKCMYALFRTRISLTPTPWS